MYPLKFEKVLKEKVWGGRSFEKLEIKLPDEKNYGESWEVSCHPNGMSVVSNGEFKGKTLQELIDIYGEKILGKIHNEYKKFPLLIKYLDVNDRLSVQVHPSDEYALRVENEYGKSECWYILEASDAKLIMGLKKDMTKEQFIAKTNAKDFDDLFNIVEVKKGDFINVNPGLVHASLEGSVVICEIQQNSDTTYRIYDFDRLVEGKLRPLHLKKACDVIDFKARPIVKSFAGKKDKIIEVVRNKYFNVDKLNICDKYLDQYENFMIYSIIEGKGKLNNIDISKGETYFIPANLNVQLEGKLEILKSYL